MVVSLPKSNCNPAQFSLTGYGSLNVQEASFREVLYSLFNLDDYQDGITMNVDIEKFGLNQNNSQSCLTNIKLKGMPSISQNHSKTIIFRTENPCS